MGGKIALLFFIGISIKMQSKHCGASAILLLSILHFVRINFVLLRSNRIESHQIDQIKCRTAYKILLGR